MAEPFSVDFPVRDKLLPFKERLVNGYYEAWANDKDGGRGYSRELFNDEIKRIVEPLWMEALNYHFHPLPKPADKFRMFVYIQNHRTNRAVWHNHPEAELNAVFYLDAPKKGGELELLTVEPSGAIFEKQKLKVEDNKLYIMPFWTYHRPLPQEDTLDRVCFNIQYHTENKKRLIQRNGIFW